MTGKSKAGNYLVRCGCSVRVCERGESSCSLEKAHHPSPEQPASAFVHLLYFSVSFLKCLSGHNLVFYENPFFKSHF